jgi:hypothetical protein
MVFASADLFVGDLEQGTVKDKGAFEFIDADGDDGNLGLHGHLLLLATRGGKSLN